MLPTSALLSIDCQKLALLDGDLFDVGKGCIVTAVRALLAARKLANWWCGCFRQCRSTLAAY